MNYPLAPSNVQQRQLIKWLRGKLGKSVSPGNIRPHTLRVYAKLSADNNVVTFDLAEAAKVLTGEVLLKDNAVFYANLMGIGILQVNAPVVNGIQKYYPGNTMPLSYPNALSFTDPNELSAIRTFFNGLLNVKSETNTRLENQLVSNFMVKGDDAFGVEEGVKHVDLSTALPFFGNKSNQITISLADGDPAIKAAITGATGTANYAVIELRGALIIDGIKARTVVESLV
jgi:hypothetical protein